MYFFILFLEVVGTVSFALSGAMTGLRKNMDLFGACTLGIITAVGGGVLRDLILGITPPTAFLNPAYFLVALGVSLAVFIPVVRRQLQTNRLVHELLFFLADSAGLGIFTVFGVEVAVEAGYGDNAFLALFVGVLTGVGGGVLRDVLAGDRPYIFVKHIYACAALAGAVVCWLLWDAGGPNLGMTVGFFTVLIIRICSARFRLNLPRAKTLEEETD